MPTLEEGRGVIKAFESNNADSNNSISYACTIFYDYYSYRVIISLLLTYIIYISFIFKSDMIDK